MVKVISCSEGDTKPAWVISQRYLSVAEAILTYVKPPSRESLSGRSGPGRNSILLLIVELDYWKYY